MQSLCNPFQSLKSLANDQKRYYYSLNALEEQGLGPVGRLPVSLRIILESLLRNCDGQRVKESDIIRLVQWNAKHPAADADVPFVVARILLQDFTGVPLLVDLAAMRAAVAKEGKDPRKIEPQVPVDLVIDHSVQVDQFGTPEAFMFNLKVDLARNGQRYAFLKWGQQAFKHFEVVPPGIGICHQVNLEYIAQVVLTKKMGEMSLLYPDTLVGADSHTTMINGLGVVGWGVGGIEAEAGMLGQPVSLQTPEVIGVHLYGKLHEGTTATDLILYITEMLRKEKVVGKFVEFFGPGLSQLTVADRATIGNMAPEYGATMGFFPVDDQTLEYLRLTGRSDEQIALVKEYLTAQGLFGIPQLGEVDFTKVLELDLNSIKPSVAGPKRPQDRIDLGQLKQSFEKLLTQPIDSGGYGKPADEGLLEICVHATGFCPLAEAHASGGKATIDDHGKYHAEWSEEEMVTNRPINFSPLPAMPNERQEQGGATALGKVPHCDIILRHGSIVIAAITSCTNTSNPAVMIGAGLLAKKAVERGLKVNPMIKTSLAPGSRVVTDYLQKTGLQPYLDALGFQLVAYGCTTCIGNSGPLDERIEKPVKAHDIIVASVLSGNRNFEARIHSSVKANFLMSPPLVVAMALAGRIDIDFDCEPLGYDMQNRPVFLHELWPKTYEINQTIATGLQPQMFLTRYAHIFEDDQVWKQISSPVGALYEWEKENNYIQAPPYFENFTLELPPLPILANMRPLAIFGDSVTTEHISPAGAFSKESAAGKYLLSLGVDPKDFNSYGSRRGNHNVMMRGTFANVRIRNKMADGKEGGFTKLMPDGQLMAIYDACQIYAERQIPLIVFAGRDYGMGSSRDWAAKGPRLLGVRAVVATSFERIHRSNLIGMGILPLQFLQEEGLQSLKLTGEESFTLTGFKEAMTPRQELTLEITRNSQVERIAVVACLNTPIEVEYYRHGGILPYVLRQLL